MVEYGGLTNTNREEKLANLTLIRPAAKADRCSTIMSAGIDAGSHGKVSTDIPYDGPIHHLRSVGSLRRSHGFGRPAQTRRQGAELEPARTVVPVERPALRPDRAALRAATRHDSRMAVVIARRDLCLLFLVCGIHGRVDAATGFGVVPLELRALPLQPARADPLGFLPALVRVRDAAGIFARPAADPDSTHRRGVRQLKPRLFHSPCPRFMRNQITISDSPQRRGER